jgi:hypothetical protein
MCEQQSKRLTLPLGIRPDALKAYAFAHVHHSPLLIVCRGKLHYERPILAVCAKRRRDESENGNLRQRRDDVRRAFGIVGRGARP